MTGFIEVKHNWDYIGKVLQEARKKQNINQTKIAELICQRCNTDVPINSKKISDYETGKTKVIPENILKVWSEVLGLNPETDFLFLDIPAIPKEAQTSVHVMEALNFLIYVIDHRDSDYLSKDHDYSLQIKYDMQDLLSKYLSERNASLKKE